MMTFLIVVVTLTVVATPLAMSLRKRASRVRGEADLMDQLRPLDLVAFRNLVDPQEEEYLRENLAPADFRRVQRARLTAAAAYVRQAAHNAGVLLRLGEAARDSSNTAIAQAGVALSEQALQLRMAAVMALLRIGAAWAWPGASLALPQVADTHQRAFVTVARLGRLQRPMRAAAFSSLM